jgi:predicted small integral membrane protein
MEMLATLYRSMAWTMPVAIFFLAIAAMLAVMTILQFVRPTVERKGFLPMTTTRGDRLFIGLLGSAWLHLAWLALVAAPLWWASILAVLWFALVLRFG